LYQNDKNHNKTTNNGFGHSSEAESNNKMQEFNIESAQYEALPRSPYRRLYGVNNRFYFHAYKKGEIWSGITTITDKVLPKSKEQIEWLMKNGYEGLNMYAQFGTAGHTIIGEMTLGNDWQSNLPEKWYNKLFDLAISYQNFLDKFPIDELLLCEAPVKGVWNSCDYITTLDRLSVHIVPYIVKKERQVPTGEFYKTGAKAGQEKMKPEKYTETVYRREVWLVDFKTNYDEKEDKSYYDSNFMQLLAGKIAVEQSYGIKVDRIFNWSEKAFKVDNGDNTYQLLEWVHESKEFEGDWLHKTYTDKKVRGFGHLMAYAESEGYNRPTGKIRARQIVNNRPIISVVSYDEFVEVWQKKESMNVVDVETITTSTAEVTFLSTGDHKEYLQMKAEIMANFDNEYIILGLVETLTFKEKMLIGSCDSEDEEVSEADLVLYGRAGQFVLVLPHGEVEESLELVFE